MIKIIKTEYSEKYKIRLIFSDGKRGEYDMMPLLAKETELTSPLKDPAFFRTFFLELGALCWENGLELSPSALYQELKSSGKLSSEQQAA